MLTDKERETIEHAAYILECICFELDLAQHASDPHDIDSDYLKVMLEGTERLIYEDTEDGWTFLSPLLNQARQIIAFHNEFSDYGWGTNPTEYDS